MEIDDTNTSCKIKRRENFMLKLEQFKDDLEDDKMWEALKCLDEAILYYEKPEIYEEVDVELVHFLIRLTKNISLQKKKQIGLYIKNFHPEMKSNDSLTWLLDFIGLLVGSCPSPDDPFNILPLKNLIKKYPDIMGLRLALAIATADKACSQLNESDFQASLKIYEEFDCFFKKKQRLSDRYRRHFPPDPLESFLGGRINTVLNYVIYSNLLGCYEDSSTKLTNALKSDWIKKAYSEDIQKLKNELKGVLYLKMNKQNSTVNIIGTQFITNVDNSPNAHIEQGTSATFTSGISENVTSMQLKTLEETNIQKIIESIQKSEAFEFCSSAKRNDIEKELYSLKKEKEPTKVQAILGSLQKWLIEMNKSGALTGIIQLITACIVAMGTT